MFTVWGLVLSSPKLHIKAVLFFSFQYKQLNRKMPVCDPSKAEVPSCSSGRWELAGWEVYPWRAHLVSHSKHPNLIARDSCGIKANQGITLQQGRQVKRPLTSTASLKVLSTDPTGCLDFLAEGQASFSCCYHQQFWKRGIEPGPRQTNLGHYPKDSDVLLLCTSADPDLPWCLWEAV